MRITSEHRKDVLMTVEYPMSEKSRNEGVMVISSIDSEK